MGLGTFITKAAKAAGKVARPVSKPIGNVLSPLTKPIEKEIINPATKKYIDPVYKEVDKVVTKVQHIPVVGQVFNITTGVHVFEAAESILDGKRIDKSVLHAFKHQMGEYQKLAPYAASIVSFVPGVGPGVGGAIAAAGALSEGRPLSQVAIEAIKGAVPGGAIAQAAFNATQAIVNKKPIEQVGIAALPVDPKVKQALATAAALTRDLASGKRVDKALMKRIDDVARTLPPDVAKAVQLGSAVGIAKQMQDTIATAAKDPRAMKAFAHIGQVVANSDKITSAAKSVSSNPQFHKGFDIATGLLKGDNVNQTILSTLRNTLTGDAAKGFDAATALAIGKAQNGHRPIAKTPHEAAAYLTTLGVAGAEPLQKTTLVSHFTSHPEMRKGATNAIKDIAATRDNRSIWTIILNVFGFR